jgi:hypothetical protein
MERFFASYLFTSKIYLDLIQILELIPYVFRIKAEPNTDAHERIWRMPIIAEEPSRRLLRPAPLRIRHARELFLKTE